jgi:DNA repair exonuclease SbcCD ATPase subunit
LIPTAIYSLHLIIILKKTFKMKKALISCLVILTFLNFGCAQKAAFLVPDRIDVEITKDEIKNLSQKDPNYKSKLSNLQKNLKESEKKAVDLEAILNQAKKEEGSSKAEIIKFKTQNGINVLWATLGKSDGIIVPGKPPGGVPCGPGGKCLEFLYFLTEECPSCDFSSFEKIRELTVQNVKYSIFKAPAKKTINTSRHRISANAYARR